MAIALVAWVLWWDVARWYEAFSVGQQPASFSVLFLALLVSLTGLAFLLFRKKWLALSLGSLVWLAYFSNFPLSKLSLLGFGILILLSLKSAADISGELDQRTKINSRVILRRGMMPFLVGIFILASFAAFESPAINRFKNMQSLPSETEGYIRVLVENTIGKNIKVRTEADRKNVIDQVSKETTHELNTFLEPYFPYAPPALAFTLFLILWGLSWIFVWLSVFLGMLIFWILKKTKVVKIEEKDVKAEVLVV